MSNAAMRDERRHGGHGRGPWLVWGAWALLALYWVALAVGSHWPWLDLAERAGMENDDVVLGVDKWLHVCGYTGLAWLAMFTRSMVSSRGGSGGSPGTGGEGAAGRKTRKWWIGVWGVGVGLILYAALDELTQGFFVPGRELAVSDWLASSTGVGLGVGAWGAMRWLRGGDAGSFVSHARLVSGLTLVSRAFGLARDWSLAVVFGFGWVYDAFVVAFMVPNLFRRLFGEGALAAAFIPQYARLKEEDAAAARRFATSVLAWLAGGLGALALVGFVGLGVWDAAAGLGGRTGLAVGLTRVTLWYMPLVCVAAVLGAVLQVHRRFAVPAASPIVLNIFIIGAAIGGAWGLSDRSLSARMLLVAAAVVAGGVVQVGWHLWGVRLIAARPRAASAAGGPRGADASDSATGPRTSASGNLSRLARRRLLRQWLPTVFGLAVLQVNTLADVLIATIFSGAAGDRLGAWGWSAAYPMDLGSVGVLGAAARLYEFPLGVFGIAVATAIFPQLASAAGRTAGGLLPTPKASGRGDGGGSAGRADQTGGEAPDGGRFAALLRQGLRLTVFIGLPASAGLLLVREPLTRAIYYDVGRLRAGDAARVAWVLAGYAPAVWAYSMNHVLMRAFYAHHNPITPMRIAVSVVALNVALNLTLIWPLGAAGLAFSTALCAAVQSVLLLIAVRRYVARPVDGAVLASWGRTAGLTLAMAAAVWAAIGGLDVAGRGWIGVVGVLALGVGVGAAVFAAGAKLLGMAEPGWLVRGSAEGKGRDSRFET